MRKTRRRSSTTKPVSHTKGKAIDIDDCDDLDFSGCQPASWEELVDFVFPNMIFGGIMPHDIHDEAIRKRYVLYAFWLMNRFQSSLPDAE